MCTSYLLPDFTGKWSLSHRAAECFSLDLRGRLVPRGYAVVRMFGVVGGNILSGLYVRLRRALDMVCREHPNAVAASGDVSPTVMEGISCCRNGDSGGMFLIMVTVLVPIAFMILEVERVGEGGMFSYLRIYTHTYTHTHLSTHIHTYTHIYIYIYTHIVYLVTVPNWIVNISTWSSRWH